MSRMRWLDEKCGDCSPRGQCAHAHYLACATQADARLAADIGVGWAHFVKEELDVRRPWPDFGGRCKAIAFRLVHGIAVTDERRPELALICWWRAGLRWEALKERHRDRPYQDPVGRGAIYALPGPGSLYVHFRTRKSRKGPGRNAADTPWPTTRKHKP
jgi:hypothetical protein